MVYYNFLFDSRPTWTCLSQHSCCTPAHLVIQKQSQACRSRIHRIQKCSLLVSLFVLTDCCPASHYPAIKTCALFHVCNLWSFWVLQNRVKRIRLDLDLDDDVVRDDRVENAPDSPPPPPDDPFDQLIASTVAAPPNAVMSICILRQCININFYKIVFKFQFIDLEKNCFYEIQ